MSVVRRRPRLSLVLAALAGLLLGTVPAAANPALESEWSSPQALEGVEFAARPDLALSRDDIMTRARTWLGKVWYNQKASHTNKFGTYRTDCSGYVSMAWGLNQSRWTGNLMGVAHTIAHRDLLPGDALFRHHNGSGHVALFHSWADAAKTKARVWEEYRRGTKASDRVWSASRTKGFTAIRYDKVLAPGQAGCTSVSKDFAVYPELKIGSAGAEVKVAQCLLAGAGFSTGVTGPDGEYGENTRSAVAQYQTKLKLASTGVVDARTWTALLSVGSTPQLLDGDSGDAVARVQQALNAAIGAKLGVDGHFGANTAAAVKSYQSTRGLGADGVVGVNTWKALQAGR